MFFFKLTWSWFSFGSRAHVRLTCCRRGRVVRKLVNTNPGFEVNRSINIYGIQMFCFVYFEIIQTQNRSPNNIQKTSLQSYETKIKILALPKLS